MSVNIGTTSVPFLDLRAMHEEVRDAIENRWKDLIDTSAFIGGTAVTTFERRFGQFVGVSHAIGVGSGTDALRIALQAAGVRQGDLVITVPHTFIATVEGITQAGADPVFVDVDPTTYTMDPENLQRYLETQCHSVGGRLLERARGRPVTCLLPVDLYGHPCSWDALLDLAQRFDLRVVEDACQAHGATWRGRPCGSFGEAAAFSFYPGKNLGAMGEAGAITSNKPELAARCRILREHGQSERYIHVTGSGSNARLDAMQAAVLDVKLDRLPDWNAGRRQAAAWYRDRLAGLDLVLPTEADGAMHSYHLFVVQVSERDRVRRELADQGIATGLHYPVPLHLQEAYRGYGLGVGAFPVSERVAIRGLSLPMFPHLTREHVEAVGAALERALPN